MDVTFLDPQDFYSATESLKQFVKNFKILGMYAQNIENVPSELTNVLQDGE